MNGHEQTNTSDTTKSKRGKYMTFLLGNENYKNKFEKKKTSIIILDINKMHFGIVIDEALSVCFLTSSQIENKGQMGSDSAPEFVTGMAQTDNNKLIILIDVLKSLTSQEKKSILKQKPIDIEKKNRKQVA